MSAKAPEPPEGYAVRIRAAGLSARLIATGSCPAAAAADFTNATPVITETYIAELNIPAPMHVTGIAVFNGSDVTGNTAVALADANGAIVASSTATAGSGTDTYQRIPFTVEYDAQPGAYFVLRQQSSATARINCHAVGNFGAGKTTGDTFGTFIAISPVRTFTADLGPVASLY